MRFVCCIYIAPSLSLVIQSGIMQIKSEHVQQLTGVNKCSFERAEKAEGYGFPVTGGCFPHGGMTGFHHSSNQRKTLV